MNRIATWLFLLALFSPIVALHAAKIVSAEDAKQLVLAALPVRTKKLPKFELEQYDSPESPQFYFFQALWRGMPNGSVVIGHYAVDKATADVWNANAACDELSTPALRNLQADVRSRIGLSLAEYRKAKRRCPLEMEGTVNSQR